MKICKALLQIRIGLNKNMFFGFGLILIISSPIANCNFFTVLYERHTFPSDGDSIGIPICGFGIAWLYFAPLFIYVVNRLRKSYPSIVPLFSWSNDKKSLSVLYTSIATLWFVIKSICIYENIIENIFWNIIYDAAWLVFIPWLRAVAVASLNKTYSDNQVIPSA